MELSSPLQGVYPVSLSTITMERAGMRIILALNASAWMEDDTARQRPAHETASTLVKWMGNAALCVMKMTVSNIG